MLCRGETFYLSGNTIKLPQLFLSFLRPRPSNLPPPTVVLSTVGRVVSGTKTSPGLPTHLALNLHRIQQHAQVKIAGDLHSAIDD